MLHEGDRAPAFELESDAGKRVSNRDFEGRVLVVYFYPKDNTPGCTREAQAFAAAANELRKAGAAVVGISKDSVKSHAGFRDKYDLNFPLLSDPDLAAHRAFGSYGEKTMYGKKVLGTIRSTFVVDRDGTIAKVFPSVKVDGHVDAVLAAIRAIDGGAPAKTVTKAAAKPPARAAKAPAKPAAKPVTKAPAKPAARTTAKPVAKAPAKPAARTTAKPVAKAPAKPAAKTTRKPVAKAPARPAARTTAKPVAKAPATTKRAR